MTSNINAPVGFIVSWSVPATVKLNDLRNGIIAAGLDPDLAPDLRPASRVARSASYIAKTTSAKDVKKLARPVAHTTRQITREDHAASGSLTYTREAAIDFDDIANRLTTDDPALRQAVADADQLVIETRTASDVTRILQRVVSGAGSDLIPVRDQGGAYFIPSGQGVIGQMASILDEIGGSLSRFACTIGHGSDESIANTITDYMLKQIGELKEAIDELNEKGIRSDVKSRRLTRVAELRERVGAYATLVGAQAAKLTEAIDTAEATLLAKLGKSMEEDTDPAQTALAGV
ncbi:MAG TPA: hypothetical protein VL333_13095 [Candidatus Saccharimonadales bacterium]|jgi:hypothetical protein|nr:hypothetical protein [Candidatus Saccharimonadales bacterium]